MIYVKTYHTQKSFLGPWPWLHKTNFFIPDWYLEGTLTQKQDLSSPQDKSIWFILFPLTKATWTILDQKCQDNSNLTKALSFDWNFPSLGQLEPFRAKKSQDSPNLIKTLSFDGNTTWIISEPKEPVQTVHVVATCQVSIPYNQGS